MSEKFRPEIAEHQLDTLFLKLFHSPSETTWSERATIATFSLNANVELGRSFAKQLVELMALAKTYAKDKTPEGTLSLLKNLTHYLQIFLDDQQTKKNPSLGKDWEKYIQRAQTHDLPKEFVVQMHYLLTEVLAEHKAEGVIGLAEFLKDKDLVPIFPEEDKNNRQFQIEPLLQNLIPLIEPTALDHDLRCVLLIAFINDDPHPKYKVRVPSFFLKSLLQFHRMDLTKWSWIDVDAQPLRQLAMLGGNNPDNFRFQYINKIFLAIQKLEQEYGLVIGGDGIIFRGN